MTERLEILSKEMNAQTERLQSINDAIDTKDRKIMQMHKLIRQKCIWVKERKEYSGNHDILTIQTMDNIIKMIDNFYK